MKNQQDLQEYLLVIFVERVKTLELSQNGRNLFLLQFFEGLE
jgi:hypothetical protein